MEIPIPEQKAKCQLVGADGNAFAIIGRARKAMLEAGYSTDLVRQYMKEVSKGDYLHLLSTTLRYVDDDSDDRWEDDS